MEQLIASLAVIFGVALVLLFFFVISLRSFIYICAPNEVLIFSGPSRWLNGRRLGYRIVKGGRGFRIPLITRVDRMDLSNMVIDLTATGAYAKGGIPLNVQGVANIKIAGNEPLLNNAIERFLGKTRQEIVAIAKATLEGSLRGVLATLTPEQVNDDKILFAERLVQEVEQDMTALGLSVDTLKIQNVMDDVKYLDSIGRKKSAEVISKARIAEALARAESVIRSAENLERETKAQIDAQATFAKADADRKLVEIRTRRDALIAEELAQVNAAVARTKAELEVQKARIEQVRRQLDADVIQPAKAASEAAESAAMAEVAPVIEEGRARAASLNKVAGSLKATGGNARQLLLMQKLPAIIEAMTNVVAETHIDKFTVINQAGTSDGEVPFAIKALVANEQLKQVFGVDLVEKLRGAAEPARQEPGPAHKTEVGERKPEPATAEEPPVKTQGKVKGRVIKFET